MAGQKRAKSGRPRRTVPTPESGAGALLVAAERLFAEHGVENVSMRQIVTAAGQANHYAVQHHFGDKSGLIRAILETRLLAVNEYCVRLLQRAERAGDVNVRSLMRALVLPLARSVDEYGRHIDAQFLYRLQQTDMSWSFMFEFNDQMPAATRIIGMLREQLGHLAEADFILRMQFASNLLVQAIVAMDTPAVLGGMTQKAYLARVVEACAAVLAQPSAGA